MYFFCSICNDAKEPKMQCINSYMKGRKVCKKNGWNILLFRIEKKCRKKEIEQQITMSVDVHESNIIGFQCTYAI